MAKKRKTKSVSRENLSPLQRLKLNQAIKSAELWLSGDDLEAFKKLSPLEKRDVALKLGEYAVNAEIIDYFSSINSVN